MIRKFFCSIDPKWLFIALLLGTAALYNYQSIIFKRPQSTHHWRQADCASLALMYYQNGMKFFEPQTHNLTSEGNTTGYVAPSEVPILYYFIAFLYKIFGYHDFIFRLVNTLIFLSGIYYLFKLFNLQSNSFFWGITGALLFFTSPVLAYYGNNFLTNSSSLSFSIIGWYLFFKYRKTRITKFFYLSVAIFCLACCMKISAGFSLFALIGVFLFEKIRILRFKDRQLFPKGIFPWVAFGLAMAIPFSWIYYAHWYNLIHNTQYFSTGTYPFWTLDNNYIDRIIDNVCNLWRTQYFSDAALIFFLLLLAVQLVFIFKNDRFLSIVLLLMLIEAVVYILLQFMTFADHDYYTIDLYIILVFLFSGTLVLASKLRPSWLNNKYKKVGFALFLLFNVYHCKNQMRMRYEGWWNEYPAYKDFHTIKPYLRQLGIAPLDTIVTIPEYSHFIHYLTNQRGWTRYADAESPHNTQLLISEDSIFMAERVANGAKYLLVLNPEITFKIMPAFKKYSKYLLGEYGSVSVYATKPEFVTHSKSKKIIADILFDAEKMDSNGENFLSADGMFAASNPATRTTEQKYSGKFGIKVTPKEPYAMTMEMNNVSLGEEYLLTVRRKGSNGKIIASALNSHDFYFTEQSIVKDITSGWDSLSMRFTITQKISRNRLKFYLWNADRDSSYFDNFRIIRKEGWKNTDIL
jgi:hypothetical protein